MQNLQVVRIVKNPLKIVKLSGTINQNVDKLSIDLVKGYINLEIGNWLVSLNTFCFRVHNPPQIETVFQVSSPICNSIVRKGKNSLPSNELTILGHIYAVSPNENFLFGNFPSTWFAVDNPSSKLELFFVPIEMTKPAGNFDLLMEVTVLFERQT